MRGRTQHCRCDDAGFRGRFERRKRVPRLDQSLQKFPAEPEVSGGTWCFPSSTRNALTSCAERLSANSDASAGTCGRGRIHDAPPIGSARSGPAQPQGVDLLLFGPTGVAEPPSERRRELGGDPNDHGRRANARAPLRGKHWMVQSATREAQAGRHVREFEVRKLVDNFGGAEAGGEQVGHIDHSNPHPAHACPPAYAGPSPAQACLTHPRSHLCAGSASSRGCHKSEMVNGFVANGSGKVCIPARSVPE